MTATATDIGNDQGAAAERRPAQGSLAGLSPSRIWRRPGASRAEAVGCGRGF